MKRIIVLFLAAILCLTVAACSKYPEGEQTPPDNRMYFVSETGVLTILCAWVLTAGLYIRVKKRL